MRIVRSMTFLVWACLFAAGPALGTESIPTVKQGIVTTSGKRTVKIAPSGKASIEILHRGDGAFLGLLTLQAGAKVPVHRDHSEEHVYVLEGGGVIILGGKRMQIKKGDSVLMPPGLEVSFENGPATLLVMQIFAGPKSAEKYDSWVERED